MLVHTHQPELIRQDKLETSIFIHMEIDDLKKKLRQTRSKHKPVAVKYLLVAEAPPDAVERFFYYEDVRKADHLFLGVTGILYPQMKDEFLLKSRDPGIKERLLRRFQEDGFYLLDLSELPLTLSERSLSANVPSLLEEIKSIIHPGMKIILVKSTVYDAAYSAIKREYGDCVINCRIPFPASGRQTEFDRQFLRALELAGYPL